MASIAHSASEPVWKRLSAWFVAFAQAAEMDSASFTEQRIQSLERRIANLERGQPIGLAAGEEG